MQTAALFSPPWKDVASTALLAYAKTVPVFTAEKAWADICKTVGEPESVSMKGYLFRAVLIKPGHLLEIGNEKAENSRAKGRKVTLWKSKLCTAGHEMQSSQDALLDIQKAIRLREITLIEGLNKAYALGAQTYLV